MAKISQLAFIDAAPKDPVRLFSNLVSEFKKTNPETPFIAMNIATLDDKFGVLNRTVVYRGLQDGHIVFVTEKNTKKYANIMNDPRISTTFLFENIELNKINTLWQIRQMGKAIELSSKEIANLWAEETVFAKIRSHISECGKPVEFVDHRKKHDQFVKDYESGQNSLKQTETYTAFKILPLVWDFYKTESNAIADRVQYRKETFEDDQWKIMHVES